MDRKYNSRGNNRNNFSHSGGGVTVRRGPIRRMPARRGFGGAYIDPSKFVNKAVITEIVEKFVPEHHFVDFAVDQRLKENIIKNKLKLQL